MKKAEKHKGTKYKGKEITIISERDDGIDKFDVYFSNSSEEGVFPKIPHSGVPSLKGFLSIKDALRAGKKEIDKHQLEFVKEVSRYNIHVYSPWSESRGKGDGRWGYCVEINDEITFKGLGFDSREKAIEFAEKAIESANEKSVSKQGKA